MDFAFGEQALEFRTQLRALTDKICTPADVRESWASETGWSSARWTALAAMGVVGLTVPEAYGGLGFGLLDLVLLLEEAGRSGLPEPLLETTALGVPLLMAAADAAADERRDRWLAAVAAGEAVIAVGTEAMTAVPAAAAADLLILEGDGELHAVPAASTVRRPRSSVDGGRRLAEVAWEPTAATRLATGEEAADLVRSLRDRGAMATGAVLLGVADRSITMTAAYAVDRVQFGAPIGSFQAVKHHLANALIRARVRPAGRLPGLLVARPEGPDAGRHASMAKALAADAATGAARVALQVHGAIGYTWEHDIHLWMKRAWSLAPAWGDARFHRARVLETLLAADHDADQGTETKTAP